MDKKHSTILIVIDLQKGFITDSSSHLLEPINRLQHQVDHIIFTKFHNPFPSPFRAILNYQKLPPDSEDTQLALAARGDAFIVDRPYYTCVTHELRQHLQSLNASQVYVCGIATEACVLKTVLDLFEHTIRTWVIEDLCASDKSEYYHTIAIELIGKLIGKEHIIKSDEIPL